MRQVTMRYLREGLAPRRTKLEIPGWAGTAARARMDRASSRGIACCSARARNTASRFSTRSTSSCA